MIRVLHVVSGLGSGGVESLLYNYYKYIDKNEIFFEFITHRPQGLYEKKLLNMGNCKIHHISFRREHPIRSAFEAYKIFKASDSSIVHFHGNKEVCLQLLAAFIARKKIRIVHSHNPVLGKNIIKRSINNLIKFFLSIFATNFMASSQIISDTSFKNNQRNKEKPIVMKNAIDVEQYTFSESKREQIRKELGVEEKFVIGNIGRFTYQKNHTFIIDIFSKVYKKNENSVLLLIGEGEGKQKIERKVKELGLEKAVRFLGVRSDIPDLMQAMDVFLFPSNFEGLGIVLIEAQASGLQCIASKKVIPKETNITDFIEYISLEESSENWANAVLRYGQGYKRKNTSEQIKIAGYDLLEQSKWLENYYKTRG
ncbi:glycosyltransferase family 1 protein [Salinicoccus roseus]|uniref:glycosyltransferase family 1 protein n=1 Tax=Salinicoccus roseus TaxID=45670 RepID=UPI002300E8E1|nr:glycosyltransferase family 1 protein [Salinicoccus roseus]